MPMVKIRPGHASPVSVLALALVVVGLVFVVRGRPTGTAHLACDPGVEPACAGGDAAAGVMPAPPALHASAPEMRSEEVCRDAGYLCAEVERTGRMQVQRWRDFGGTLVVHVPLPDLEDRGHAHALRRAAAAGVRAWNGQPFPILVDERGTRDAHVRVQWDASLGGSVLGQARLQWSSQSGLSVLGLHLVTRSPGARPLDSRDVRLVAAHEMGHALGLPHSDDPHDLMYPQNTALAPSTRDYRTLEALYRLPDGTVIVR